MQDFRKLRAWQESRALTTKIYRVTATFPETERFGLISQMRAAMISIGANMAEGCGRATRPDTLRFFQMSHLERVRRMTAGFMRRLHGGPG